MSTHWSFKGDKPVRHFVPPIPEDDLCTTCWCVAPCEHFPDPARSEDPERFQPYHLCTLCARTWAPLRSRWSWMACRTCLQIDKRIDEAYGAHLPLGRHTIMNGASVNLGETEAVQAAQRANLDFIVEQMQALRQYGREQAATVQRTLMPKPYREASLIPTDVWEEYAQPSWQASCETWLRYVGLTTFEQLTTEMLRLYDSGEYDRPEHVPGPDWRP